MQEPESLRIIRVVKSSNSGIENLKLGQVAVGMVVHGAVRLYYNGHTTTIRAGEVFLLGAGIYTVSHTVEEGIFEAAVILFSASDLQRVIITLIEQCNIAIKSSHSCTICRYHNFISLPAGRLSRFFLQLESESCDTVICSLRLAEFIIH